MKLQCARAKKVKIVRNKK